jgi:hypothetical protein
MKSLWDVNGSIKCGKRSYNVQKYIVADIAQEALEIYKRDYPHAYDVVVKYKYGVKPSNPQIIFTNVSKDC